MNIGLVACDRKKELMMAFCIAYKGILEKHNLFATGTTGTMLENMVGLNINKCAYGLTGQQQLEAKAAYNELDLVIYFRSPYVPEEEIGLVPFISSCDANNIPIATNLATAEVIIVGLERGDLMWRENVEICE